MALHRLPRIGGLMEVVMTDIQLVGIVIITLSIGTLIGYYVRTKEKNRS